MKSLIGLALVLVVVTIASSTRSSVGEASPVNLFTDSDGDQLPDVMEIAFLTDPSSSDTDDDGRDDFLDALAYEARTFSTLPPAEIRDHQMRTGTALLTHPDGSEEFWLFAAMNLVDRDLSSINGILPFFRAGWPGGYVEIPLSPLVASVQIWMSEPDSSSQQPCGGSRSRWATPK